MGTVVHLKRRATPDRVDSCSDCRHQRGSDTSAWQCGALSTPCSVVRQQLHGTPCPHFALKPPSFLQRVEQWWQAYLDRY